MARYWTSWNEVTIGTIASYWARAATKGENTRAETDVAAARKSSFVQWTGRRVRQRVTWRAANNAKHDGDEAPGRERHSVGPWRGRLEADHRQRAFVQERESHDRREQADVEDESIDPIVDGIVFAGLPFVEHHDAVVLAHDVPVRPERAERQEEIVGEAVPDDRRKADGRRSEDEESEATAEEPGASRALVPVEIRARDGREDVRTIDREDPRHVEGDGRHAEEEMGGQHAVGDERAADQKGEVAPAVDHPDRGGRTGVSAESVGSRHFGAVGSRRIRASAAV